MSFTKAASDEKAIATIRKYSLTSHSTRLVTAYPQLSMQ